MKVLSRLVHLAVLVLVALLGVCTPLAAETPALNAVGTLLSRDVRFEMSYGEADAAPRPTTAFRIGVAIDKPVISHFLDLLYEKDVLLPEPLQKDRLFRDAFIEPIRFDVRWIMGDTVTPSTGRVDRIKSEYFIGVKYSLELGRVLRHLPVFQK